MSRFDKAAKDWDANDMRTQLSNNIAKTLMHEVTLTPSMHIMDFGAGTGLLSSHVAPKVAKIAAVDISAGMLNELSQKEELKAVVHPYCQNILHDPLDEDFDGIISAMALHHVEDTDEILQVFYDHLKPGAFIAIADLDKEDGTFHSMGNEGIFHFGFERDGLQKQFEKLGFKNVSFTTAHTITKEDAKSYPIFLVTASK
ncbi:MAG: class I SAM-dependent methyltransferase [Campylobacterota bacterium]|nr:class I SAM-dependent methyltransferase [Campylobacterota bacterium]